METAEVTMSGQTMAKVLEQCSQPVVGVWFTLMSFQIGWLC